MSPSNDPQANMTAQADFMRSSFESLVTDFKELSEMYSKANLETFDAASKKVAKQMGQKDNCATSSCSPKDMKTANSKAKK